MFTATKYKDEELGEVIDVYNHGDKAIIHGKAKQYKTLGAVIKSVGKVFNLNGSPYVILSEERKDAIYREAWMLLASDRAVGKAGISYPKITSALLSVESNNAKSWVSKAKKELGL